jgi:hypothetical protein
MYQQIIIDKPILRVFNVPTLNQEATMEKTPALLAQVGYMLDHPGTLGEIAAYMKRLEDKNGNLAKACSLLLEWVAEGDRGMPNPDTLADAVTFAKLALK